MSDFILACVQAIFELLLNIQDWVLLRNQPATRKQTIACWLVVLICVVLLVWFTAANSE